VKISRKTSWVVAFTVIGLIGALWVSTSSDLGFGIQARYKGKTVGRWLEEVALIRAPGGGYDVAPNDPAVKSILAMGPSKD
jgi:hypothetical protein